MGVPQYREQRKYRFCHPFHLLACLAFLIALRTFLLADHSQLDEETKQHHLLKVPSSVPPLKKNRPLVDFFIAGFAKCGTTSLLSLFNQFPETAIPDTEVCSPFKNQISDEQGRVMLEKEVNSLVPRDTLRGVKCPGGVKIARAIERMQLYAPKARWIIGIRHPVTMFESYYNYRITELYRRNESLANVPAAESLTSIKKQWKAVSTDITRYEWFLMQLGKTYMTTAELQDYTGGVMKTMRVVPNNITVFLYEVHQFSDRGFRTALGNYLGIASPLPAIPRSNVNEDRTYPESIQICDSRFDDLRQTLVQQATVTARWILSEFLSSNDVVVAMPGRFRTLLKSWNKDPCAKD